MGNKSERYTRRDALKVGGALAVVLLCRGSLEVFESIMDSKYDESINELDKKYGLDATAIAQDAEWQKNVAGKLYYATGIIAQDDKITGCSTSFIGKDVDRGIVYLLTANHCLRDTFETFTIRQPQLSNSKEITVDNQNVRYVSHPEGKDIAIIALRSSQAVEQLSTIAYSPFNQESKEKELCAMIYPGLDGQNSPQVFLAVKTNIQDNILGLPRQEGNKYILESSGWGGISGSGFSVCENNTVIGVAVSMNLLDHGRTRLELLDNHIDKMILDAGNLFNN